MEQSSVAATGHNNVLVDRNSARTVSDRKSMRQRSSSSRAENPESMPRDQGQSLEEREQYFAEGVDNRISRVGLVIAEF